MKQSPAAKKRIAELSERVKSLKQVVAKRNELIHNLNSQLYNMPIIFYLYENMRDVHEELTKDLWLPDYYILAYASLMDSFTQYEVDVAFAQVPKSQLTALSQSGKSCITRLCKLGYCMRRKIQGRIIYFLTTNGRYFLMNMGRKIRAGIVAAIVAQGKIERNIFVNRKLKRIYGY
jgi:hypothetical protein